MLECTAKLTSHDLQMSVDLLHDCLFLSIDRVQCLLLNKGKLLLLEESWHLLVSVKAFGFRGNYLVIEKARFWVNHAAERFMFKRRLIQDRNFY